MATTVDTLLVRIEADMSDLSRGLKKVQRDVDRSSSKIGGSLKKIGGAMKGLVAAALVRQGFIAGKAMIDLASDIEEMQGKSKVVFGRFRAETVEALEQFGNEVGRSTHELEGMAASIQDTFVPMGFARGEASKLSVELTKLAVDVASFNNASDTETMAAFQSALVGNHETVRRFGVIITETTLNQELMRMGVEKGTKAATEAEKVQARLNLITEGTSDAAGDAARTSDSYANTLRGLKAEFSELAGELGTIFLPIMTKILSAFTEGVKKAKAFLQEMGIIKTPLGEELAKLNGELEVAEQSLNEAATAYAAAVTAANSVNADQFAGHTVDGARMSVDLLTEAYDKLYARRLIVAEEFAMNLPVPDSGQIFPNEGGTSGGTSGGGSGTTTTEAAKQLKAFKAADKARRHSLMLENSLSAARQRGDEDAIRSAIKAIEVNKLRSKFALVAAGDEMPALVALGAEIGNLIFAEEQRAKILKSQREAQQELNASGEAGLGFVRANIDLLYEHEQVQKNLNVAKQQGSISEKQYREAMALVAETIKELNPLYKSMRDEANAAFEKTADALTDMVMKGKFDLKSLGNIFKSTIKEMIADALKAQIIKPMLRGIFGGIGGAIGGPLGGIFTGIGQSADGGSLNRGVPQIVGERGPELIVPKASSNILNNHNTKNAMGGGAATIVNQTINVSAGVSQTVRAEMVSLLPRFKQETLSSVLDAKRRGGSFGNAFA
jgi:hypothetical protein